MKRGADGKETMEGAGDSDVQNRILRKIFEIEADPIKLTLDSVEKYLKDLAARKTLEESLTFMSNAMRRSTEGGIGVPSTWTGLPPLHEDLKNVAVERLKASTTGEKIKALSKVMDLPTPAKLLHALLAAAVDEAEVAGGLLLEICKPLKGRMLNNLKQTEFRKLVNAMKADKRYGQALVTSPCREEIWRPHFEPKFTWKNRKKEVIGCQREGFHLQAESVLGWILKPSALDAALSPPSQVHLTEAGTSEWSNVRQSRHAIQNRQKSTQMKLIGAQQQASEFVDLMLRAGDEPRIAILTWLGTLMTAAEPRGSQGHVIPDGFNFWPQQGHHVIDVLGNDKNHPIERSFKHMLLLQSLQARIQGFPTSGVALNAFALLLHLTYPIKLETAGVISPYFAMREDISQFLGAWSTKNEARFGDKEQVEKAMELAKADACFTAPPETKDKVLISTEIFWLASKGVGTLFLPVAREAYHCFYGVAATYQDKAPQDSDVAWREYLLTEASVKEQGFIDKLSHLVNLQFRFLQTAAAGGKQTLPPPTPGPEWHALPSTMLENVLDICDLYRRDYEKKGGQIPTGIFATLDPNPILTTLCIVMASDDHVRDPSLRGRAVKLMHRLCFAFHSWQEKLNQPPLREHLIPCLVGVFVGVEKAIMSYYDLSYRYKYELRLPVMDLFDLALQQECHRKVLHEFVRGEGNERFLKLMTQLINDSNSQIEEAIKTLKDYQADKGKEIERASRPGRQHDEQVLEDDNTGEGEDVYRRSRMNFKEHAKKYFSLSSRTWKQLWLLCKECAGPIIEGQGGSILEQLLHTSLDAQLHFLVGPEMKNIKGTPAEYQELGFDPKDMVKKIAEILLFLVRVNRDEVLRVIAKDERYYSGTTFSKAVNFIKKYNLLAADDFTMFDNFAKELATKTQQTREAFQNTEIPDNFMCELMADIMSDPVMLPQSKKIVDRNNAWRCIAGTDRDPYSNTPVKMEDLIPQVELKQEIHRFAKEKGIALEGGNMFD
jgi:hypothetical protein